MIITRKKGITKQQKPICTTTMFLVFKLFKFDSLAVALLEHLSLVWQDFPDSKRSLEIKKKKLVRIITISEIIERSSFGKQRL